jgi:Carboxypeptidase regulatory-like domain
MRAEARLNRLFATVVAALLWTSGSAIAQSQSDVTGHVLDAQGQPLQGIEIKLHQIGGKEGQKQASGADGAFRFEKLGFGTYSVTAAPEGYAPAACPGFRLLPGTTKQFEIRLAPAEGDQTSSCADAAPASPGS